MHLHFEMILHRYNGDEIYLPCTWVSLERNNVKSEKMKALIDSGASYNVASFELCDMLEISRQEVAAAPKKKLVGLSSKSDIDAFQLEVDLHFVSDGQRISLPKTKFHFCEMGKLNQLILLGQRDTLERVIFIQKNLKKYNHRLLLKIP